MLHDRFSFKVLTFNRTTAEPGEIDSSLEKFPVAVILIGG
jgi:hypothetical protein